MSRGLCCRASVTSLMAELGWGRKGWEGEEGMGKWDGRDQPHCPPEEQNRWMERKGWGERMDGLGRRNGWEGRMDNRDKLVGWVEG